MIPVLVSVAWKQFWNVCCSLLFFPIVSIQFQKLAKKQVEERKNLGLGKSYKQNIYCGKVVPLQILTQKDKKEKNAFCKTLYPRNIPLLQVGDVFFFLMSYVGKQSTKPVLFLLEQQGPLTLLSESFFHSGLCDLESDPGYEIYILFLLYLICKQGER